jgi:trans-aconitate 2-methyltransferase
VSKTLATLTRWNAADYAAHSSVQQTWARELIAQLRLRGDEHVLDVGCGDGKVTAEIARAVPRGAVVGVDASAEMIAFAQKTFPSKKSPNLEFHVMDARHVSFDRRFDLLFSNAALHWVDDHRAFLRGAASVLKPGGRLIVSCGGFFRKLEKPYFFYSPADYEKWLPRFGFRNHRVELAPKDAVYNGRDGFAAWLRTTWLPYVQRVPEDLREEFIAGIAGRYLAKRPPDADGRVHVRMVRLEIDAVRR